MIERPPRSEAVYTGAAMREGRLIWLILFLLLGTATQCQREDGGLPVDVTADATTIGSAVEPTATAPPSPTAISTAVANQVASPAPELTTTPTITATVIAGTATAAPPTPTPILYTVEEGDTLLAIAIDRGTTVEEILALNPGLQAGLLQIGQQVVLPAETAAVGTAVGGAEALPSGVEVTGLGTYENPAGGWWILGEVVNGSEQAVENVQVTVDLLDGSGNVLQSQATWAANSVIRAGGRSPFGILVVDAAANFDHAAAMVTAGNGVNSLGSRYLDLSVTVTESAEEGGVVQFTGEVVNEGAAVASGIVVVVTFYDAEGGVTGYVLHEVEGDLAPGAASPFTLDVVPPGGAVEDYRMTAEGDSQ